MKFIVFVCNYLAGITEGTEWKNLYCVFKDGESFETSVQKVKFGDFSIGEIKPFIGKICSIECSYKKGKLVLLSIKEEVNSNVA